MSRRSNKTNVAKSNQKKQRSKKGAFIASTTTSESAVERLWLYRFVYRRRHVSALFLVLIISFVLQPFEAQADDSLEQAEGTEAEISTEVIDSLEDLSEDTSPPEQTVEEEAVIENSKETLDVSVGEPEDAREASDLNVTESDVSLEETDTTASTTTNMATATTETDEVVVTQDSEDTLNLTIEGFDVTATTSEVLHGSTTIPAEEVVPESEPSATSSDAEVEQPPPNDSPPPSTTPSSSGSTSSSNDDLDVVDEVASATSSEADVSLEVPELPTTTASSTADAEENDLPEDSGEFDPNLVSVVESDSAFTFDREECTRVDSGAYYCQSRTKAEIPSDALLALPDADGDLEIFLTRNGEQVQITRNQYDDSSPYYDDKSNTIVWHRLIDDRHQIISYDVETGEETQITDSSENNMEPARHGKHTVWQRWLDGNWEIVLYDGRRELRVTETIEHDIAPNIRGSLIIWNAQQKNGDHQLRTFDIESNTRDVISDSEGVSVENPRMIVLYEALYENGDIVTKGFDLVSGEIVPVQSLPRQLPDELPDADTTGETRAIIQSKPTVKEDSTEVTLDSDLGFDDDTTLNLSSGTTSATTTAEDVADEYTLVIESTATTSDLIDDEALDIRATSTGTSSQSS